MPYETSKQLLSDAMKKVTSEKSPPQSVFQEVPVAVMQQAQAQPQFAQAKVVTQIDGQTETPMAIAVSVDTSFFVNAAASHPTAASVTVDDIPTS